MKKYSFVLMLSLSLSQALNAANFTIKEGETVNTQQVLPDEGDKGTIEKGGTLATGATTAVHMQNGNQKLKNSGEISTNGVGAIGISSTDADVKINNRGKILTTGVFSDGIDSTGANAKIKNRGKILTTGAFSDGIDSTGANAKIKNSGVISVNGSFSYGIDNFGTNAKIKNSGEIFTNGSGSVGILSNGVNANTKNSGEISTNGMSAFGIASNGANARVENSGRITTSGDFARGIQIFRENSEVKNTGEISTTGASADGIYSFGVNAHITNSGIIKSEQGFALNFVNINPTLTLKRGSNIQGRVYNDQPMNLYVKKGLNLDLTVEGAGFNAIGIDDPFVVDGLSVVVVDRSGFALQADFLADLSDTVLGGVAHSRVNGCCIDPCSQGFWLAGIGSYRERSSKDRIVGIRNKQAGILFGYDTSLCDGNAGIFGSIMYGNPEVSRHTQHAETKSYIGGVNYNKAHCGTCYRVSVAGGYVDWENRRHVMNNLVDGGEETGKANLDGGFVSAEVSLSEQACCLPCSPMMSVSLRYAGLYFGDYKEKGVTAPLSVKGRTIDLLTTRVELAFTENSFHTYSLCVEPYFGFYGRCQLQGKRVDGELLEEELSFTQGNHHSLAAVLFGLRATRECCSNTLFINLETDFDNHRSSRFIGEIGVRF